MSNYFSKVPNFEYVSRFPDAKISDYITVKNLFKKGVLADDLIDNLSVHNKYKIKGDDRPDNVSFKVYGTSNLDWLVLTCNNILNVQTEWPLLQNDFDRFLLDKYGTYAALNDTHHYETQEIKNSKDVIIVPKGLECESDYSITYFDYDTQREVTVLSAACTTEVTNFTYEERIEDAKRNIFIVKPEYINIIQDDISRVMTYKEGSTQYVSETLKRAENIRLYS
jgi:hypothetical protein